MQTQEAWQELILYILDGVEEIARDRDFRECKSGQRCVFYKCTVICITQKQIREKRDKQSKAILEQATCWFRV